RRFRSVRGFRPDLRRVQAVPEDGRGPDPVRQPDLWRNPDIAVPPWRDAAANGAVRLHAHQGDVTLMPDALERYRSAWQGKPVVRAVYDDFYRRPADASRPGPTIELGGGIGNLKQRLTDVIATDIQWAPWLDCVADAQGLPFADECAANIVMVDVLHHV